MRPLAVCASIAVLLALFPAWESGYASPTLPDVISDADRNISLGAKTVVERYFEASKKGDAKTAVSLIDYEEWAKDLNLAGGAKKAWIDDHKSGLQQTYDGHRREGSTKQFKIMSSELHGNEAVYNVSQQRVGGEYIWEVKLISGLSGWRIKGFRLMKVQPAGR